VGTGGRHDGNTLLPYSFVSPSAERSIKYRQFILMGSLPGQQRSLTRRDVAEGKWVERAKIDTDQRWSEVVSHHILQIGESFVLSAVSCRTRILQIGESAAVL